MAAAWGLWGPAALADVVDLRAQHLFTQTVVDLSAAEVQADATQEITNLEVRRPPTARREWAGLP
ncbi:hypothetical protein [Streptomyces sp900116325]|uniref:hypothetical protein n=1 Tax=Streptomyces sp. 900116325 TaxID=3154295 RepID=UPI0033A84276